MTHLTNSLQSAANLVVKAGCPSMVDVSLWATTYRCAESDVRDALKIAENGSRKLPEEQAASVKSTMIDEVEE